MQDVFASEANGMEYIIKIFLTYVFILMPTLQNYQGKLYQQLRKLQRRVYLRTSYACLRVESGDIIFTVINGLLCFFSSRFM